MIYLQDSVVFGVKCYNIFCIRKWLGFCLTRYNWLYMVIRVGLNFLLKI